MRIIVALFLLSLLGGCKKEKSANALYIQFQGTWEYEKHLGFITDSLPPGNGRFLHLSNNGSLERRQHDTVLFSGSYVIQEKADCSPRENKLFFSTNDSAFLWDGYIELKEGKLTLTTTNCQTDGGTTFYRRIGAALND